MDDEYVAVRAVRYPFADTLPEQAKEDVRLARADDDQIRLALLGKLDDRFCRIAHGRNKLALQAVFLESRAGVLELFRVSLRRVGRVDCTRALESARKNRRHACHDEVGPERFREFYRPELLAGWHSAVWFYWKSTCRCSLALAHIFVAAPDNCWVLASVH